MFWKRKKKTPQELMAAGNFKGAIKAFHAQIKEKKEQDPALMMQLGGAYMKAGKLQDAKQVYAEVGTYYGDRGFFNKSVAAFKKALNITPDDSNILEKLASYNDKVPKFMIDANILARLKKEAATHQTGEHPAMTTEELEAASATQEVDAADVPPPTDESEAVEEAPTPPVADAPSPAAPEEPDALPASDVAHTAELNREQILAAAKAQVEQEAAADQKRKKKSPPPPTLDQTFEEITDLDTLDESQDGLAGLVDSTNDGFVMDFGEAKPTSPEDLAPLKPSGEPAPEPKIKTELGQPLTRGGMVFKTQNEPKPQERAQPTGVFDSVDDALDNIFAGGGDGGDLFGLDDSIAEIAPPVPEPPAEATELTFADASPEENTKHWPLFRTMPSDVLMALILALETRDYEVGETIVRQGDPGDEMFLIAEGQVDIIVSIGGEPTKVASLGEGDFFGEASLLSGEPRNATVQTTTPTNCLLLSSRDLKKLTLDHPSVKAAIESIYYTRIQENASRTNDVEA